MSIPAVVYPADYREPFVPKRNGSCPQFTTTKVSHQAAKVLLASKEVQLICHNNGTTSYEGVSVNIQDVKSIAILKGKKVFESWVYIPQHELMAVVLTTYNPVPKKLLHALKEH